MNKYLGGGGNRDQKTQNVITQSKSKGEGGAQNELKLNVNSLSTKWLKKNFATLLPSAQYGTDLVIF